MDCKGHIISASADVAGDETSTAEGNHSVFTGIDWQPPVSSPFKSFIHRGSISTSDSESNSSNSPTSGPTLLESSSVSETPSTSPDTPASSHSLAYNSIPTALRSTNSLDSKVEAPRSGFADFQRVPPTPRKARNLKNLAVDTITGGPLVRAAATATFPMINNNETQNRSALPPPTPGAFMRPLKTPSRKNSALGLTIKTRADPPPSMNRAESGIIPPTPSLVRPATLRHFQSSPSLPALAVATSHLSLLDVKPQAPPMGRRFTGINLSEVLSEQDEAQDSPQNFDVPQSREEKPESYPDGPICIYDPNVYLFFEPSAQEASNFDVIFNVASEVKNPFKFGNPDRSHKDVQAATESTNKAPIKSVNGNQSSVLNATIEEAKDGRPEYIHVPWEHNTDIVPDLYHLVKMIDERVQASKKVLIHCQCGVSRSASLIVAYGIYKSPNITVQEAYDTVKRRSKWISPNMNLIMQLQEFRSGLQRNSNTSRHVPTRSRTMTASNMHTEIPKSAPLQPDANKLVPPPINVDRSSPIQPGPSSAPSDFTWSPAKAVAIHPRSAYVDASGHVVPENAVATAETANGTEKRMSLSPIQTKLDATSRAKSNPAISMEEPIIESPRSAQFSMNSALPPDVDETFGLTSPRNATFNALEWELQTKTTPRMLPMPMNSVTNNHVPAAKDSFAETLVSPRSEQFAMTSFQAPFPENDFGLTSPRSSSFGSASHAFGSTNSNSGSMLSVPNNLHSKRMSAILPTQEELGSIRNFQARAELRSIIGMSTRSNADLRGAYNGNEDEQKQQVEVVYPPVVEQQSTETVSEVDEALMSPRATEFTTNPFDTATASSIGLAPIAEEKRADHIDPRSPAQKGQSPIVRNIATFL